MKTSCVNSNYEMNLNMPATEELDDVETQSEDQSGAVAETPAIPPEPPKDCPAHVREHYDTICEKEREVRSLEGQYMSAKEDAAEAKKGFEAADKALRNLIAFGSDPQLKLPLGDGMPPAPEAWRADFAKDRDYEDDHQELLDEVAGDFDKLGILAKPKAKAKPHRA